MKEFRAGGPGAAGEPTTTLASNAKRAMLGAVGVTILATVAATAWLLKPTWDAYRERYAFEQAARTMHVNDSESIQKLAKLVRQAGFPQFVESELDRDRAILVPFYLRSYWYCVYRPAWPVASERGAREPAPMARLYRLEIPLEHYEPQSEDARNLVSRVRQIEVRNTPSGPVEEPALPLEGEEARRVAFFWDFYQLISGRAGPELQLKFELLRSESAAN